MSLNFILDQDESSIPPSWSKLNVDNIRVQNNMIVQGELFYNKARNNNHRTFAISDNTNNKVYIIDTDKMEVIDTINTEGAGPYPIDLSWQNLFVSTRGSSSVDILDVTSFAPKSTISLSHKPRSSTFNNVGLMAVGGGDKVLCTIINAQTLEVLGTFGPGTAGPPALGDFGGSLASGHPQWIDSQHFIICDRVDRKLRLYNIYSQTQKAELALPTSPHHVIADTDSNFYCVCEGNQGVPIRPSIMKFNIQNWAFTNATNLPLQDGIDNPATMGAHHCLIMPLANAKKLYCGSTEGRVFIIDLPTFTIDKTLVCGAGVGHVTPYIPRGPGDKLTNRAITINHKGGSVTVLDITPGAEAVLATVVVDPVAPGGLNSIGHTSWFSKDGKKAYFIGARINKFYELDIAGLAISRTLDLAPAYSTYIPQGTAWDGTLQGAYPYNQAEVM